MIYSHHSVSENHIFVRGKYFTMTAYPRVGLSLFHTRTLLHCHTPGVLAVVYLILSFKYFTVQKKTIAFVQFCLSLCLTPTFPMILWPSPFSQPTLSTFTALVEETRLINISADTHYQLFMIHQLQVILILLLLKGPELPPFITHHLLPRIYYPK